jgi:diguanylate cyclase (GGDEF)-like protein/PAS domain S-box-containing protein
VGDTARAAGANSQPDSTEETAVSLGRLLELTEAIHGGRELGDLLTVLISRAAELPHVDTVRVLLTDRSGTRLQAEASVGFPEGDDAETLVPIGSGFSGRIAQNRRVLLVDDIENFPVHTPSLRAARVRSALGVPLLAGDRMIGVLHVGSRRPGVFRSEAIPLLESIAERVALTVEAIRAESALNTSERRFRTLFEDAPVGICIVDLDPQQIGDVLSSNAAMSRVTGYPPERLVGMSAFDLISEEDQALSHRSVDDLTAGRLSEYSAERRLVRSDGSEIWVRISVACTYESGRPALAIAYFEDITAHKTAEAELERRALLDPLTGLANRTLVMDHLTLALRQRARSGGLVGLLYLDLDRFKDVNDVYGHDIGDQLLREVASRLSTVVRAADTAGRLGGDEFIVVCPQLQSADEMGAVAQRLLDALGHSVTVPGAPPLEISASIGTALGEQDIGSEELLRRADLAMYEAKRLGRRRWYAYQPMLDQATHQRRARDALLRTALESGWLRLLYQPIVSLNNGTVAGAEALLRIEHPDAGVLLPSSFIDALEDGDLSQPIEEWVLQEACAFLHDWTERDLPHLSVNVSGRLARSGRLSSTVVNAARVAGVDASRLCVDMSERVLIDAGPRVIADLSSLAQAGVQIAIDDFGTGFASLASLQKLPVDAVKIDRSFVSGLGANPRDDAIVAAVTALGTALNLLVIAEGVERRPQATRLRQVGCGLAQGYHFGPPMSSEQFRESLPEFSTVARSVSS